MLKPHPHLSNHAVFRDIATKSGNPGHNRVIGPNSGTILAIPGHLATMHSCLKTVSNSPEIISMSYEVTIELACYSSPLSCRIPYPTQNFIFEFSDYPSLEYVHITESFHAYLGLISPFYTISY